MTNKQYYFLVFLPITVFSFYYLDYLVLVFFHKQRKPSLDQTIAKVVIVL